MASNISVFIKFSDGTFTYLRDSVTLDTLTEIQTDASGLLNITGDISLGQAYTGKVATHALAKVVTDSAASGCFCYGAFYAPDGTVLCPIQGGGYQVTGLPALIKPVRMTTGVVCKAQAQAQADSVQIGAVAFYCASGYCDVLFGVAIDDTDVPMLNAQGATLGQSAAGQTIVGAYSTYGATYGLADTGIADGVGGFFAESSDGSLKMMYAPDKGLADSQPVPYQSTPFRVDQHDTMTLRAHV